MASSTLRLKVRCSSVAAGPVEVTGCLAETTFDDFKTKIAEALGVLVSSDDQEEVVVLAGFPPRPLTLDGDAAIGSVLSDNESVTVRLPTESALGANPEGGSWSRSRQKGSARVSATSDAPGGASSTRGRVGKGKAKDKRRAAESSGTTAAADDTRRGGIYSLSSAQPRTPPSSGTMRAGRREVATGGSPPGQVRTLFGTTSTTGRSISPAGARAPARLNSSHPAACGDESESSRKRARSKNIQLGSESDIAERLLQAVSGKGQGIADRFFRKAMKLAVDKQYDQSKADARVRAAMGGWFTLEANASQRKLGDGESVSMHVSFSKGIGAKTRFQETVDRIPREQVAAVVRLIAQGAETREMLKPHNFAGCSPRMFWSLVEYWGGDIPAALRLAAPDLDWSFLSRRDRRPSEKASENARVQEQERQEAEEDKAEKERQKEAKRKERERKRRRREGLPSDSSCGEEDTPTPDPTRVASPGSAQFTTAIGEQATMGASTDEPMTADTINPATQEARHRAAHAAAARLKLAQQSNSGTSAHSTTASLVTAISESASLEQGVDLKGLMELVPNEEAAQLLINAGAGTPSQLADCDGTELAAKMAALQTDAHHGAGVAAEDVRKWVQEAQVQELDDIMAEIIDGHEDVVEALEQVLVSTPRDLARLAAFPDLLVRCVRDQLGADRFGAIENKFSLEAVAVWSERSEALLVRRPWLCDWTHGG